MALKASTDERLTLRCYLLGRLSPVAEEQVEDRFADADYFSFYQEVERELLCEYATKTMEATAKAAFEQNYLITEKRRKNLAVFQALLELQAEQSAAESRLNTHARAPVGAVIGQRRIVAWAIAACLVCAVGGTALYLRSGSKPQSLAMAVPSVMAPSRPPEAGISPQKKEYRPTTGPPPLSSTPSTSISRRSMPPLSAFTTKERVPAPEPPSQANTQLNSETAQLGSKPTRSQLLELEGALRAMEQVDVDAVSRAVERTAGQPSESRSFVEVAKAIDLMPAGPPPRTLGPPELAIFQDVPARYDRANPPHLHVYGGRAVGMVPERTYDVYPQEFSKNSLGRAKINEVVDADGHSEADFSPFAGSNVELGSNLYLRYPLWQYSQELQQANRGNNAGAIEKAAKAFLLEAITLYKRDVTDSERHDLTRLIVAAEGDRRRKSR